MKRIIYSVLAAVLVCSCAPSKLVIVHVNDTHSHHEAFRYHGERDCGGIVERGAIVDSIRAEEGAENVLLLHAGDFNQGSSYYSRYGGFMEVEAFNAFGYDCVTLGNHEFDNGLDDLAARLALLKTPVVCANLKVEGTVLEPYVKPYAIVKKAGRKIGVIGITTNLRAMVSASVSSVLAQYDDVETVNKWASYLKKEEKCDMVIVLSHIGYEEDCELVQSLSGVDLVVGGHSHTFVDDLTWVRDKDGKTVPVIQNGCWGINVGKITVR